MEAQAFDSAEWQRGIGVAYLMFLAFAPYSVDYNH